MNCPFCNHKNIPGVDECAHCDGGLAGFNESDSASEIERDLLHRSLGEILAHDYIEVRPTDSVRDVVNRLNESGSHCAFVVDESKLVGIFTERDVLNKIARDYSQSADNAVSEFMTAHPVALKHDEPIVFGLNRMVAGDYRHIPIFKDGKLTGVVSVRDILRYMVEHFDEWLPATVAN